MNNELQKRILSSIILIPITIFFIFKGTVFFAYFLLILFLTSSYEWIKLNKNDIVKIIGIFYLFFAFYLAYLLREKFTFGLFILILIICIFTDLGGYLFGKILKGPKLTKISPKKTYSGALGGFILSLIAATAYTNFTVIGSTTYLNLSTFIMFSLAVDNMFILFILFISFISQTGDLIISYFKRLAKAKDTGNLLPGHGGLLDRVDGIIFAIPASYLLLMYLK